MDFSAAGFDAHQAYGFFPVVDGVELKIGRQEIILDNSRLVGNVGWTQRARSFDAARALFHHDGFEAGLLFSKVRGNEVYADGHVPPDREGQVGFGGLHVAMKFAEGETKGAGSRVALLYLLNDRFDTPDGQANQLRQTVGGIANAQYGGFKGSLEGYYQFGTQTYAVAGVPEPNQTISAFLTAGRLNYTFPIQLKPGAGAWAEYLSGDGTPAGVFDTLYATNHKFYGYMDLFISIPRDTANLGLFDAGAQVSVGPVKNISAKLDWHHFRAASEDALGNQTFGNEVDLVLNYRFTEHLTAQAVWTVFFPEAAMGYALEGLPASADLKTQQLGYFTLDFKI